MQLLTAQPILEKVNWESFQHLPQKTLAIVLVGNDPASELYVSIKERTSAKYNVRVEICRFSESISTEELCQAITQLNDNQSIDALIVQLPLPEHLDTRTVLATINPRKDVDNLTGANVFTSPMVRAVKAMMACYNIDLRARDVCVVGQGVVVGQPIINYLETLNIPVACVDKDTPDADEIILNSRVIFGASGVQNRINVTNSREGQIIFDCSGKDVDFEHIKEKCAAITPPKGGIGPLTVHFLFMNVRETL